MIIFLYEAKQNEQFQSDIFHIIEKKHENL